jgi:hypothetical protein
MRKSNFARRLQPSLLEEARKLAEAEGVALNQLINVAVAENLRWANSFSALNDGAVIRKRKARQREPAGTPEDQHSDQLRSASWSSEGCV